VWRRGQASGQRSSAVAARAAQGAARAAQRGRHNVTHGAQAAGSQRGDDTHASPDPLLYFAISRFLWLYKLLG